MSCTLSENIVGQTVTYSRDPILNFDSLSSCLSRSRSKSPPSSLYIGSQDTFLRYPSCSGSFRKNFDLWRAALGSGHSGQIFSTIGKEPIDICCHAVTLFLLWQKGLTCHPSRVFYIRPTEIKASQSRRNRAGRKYEIWQACFYSPPHNSPTMPPLRGKMFCARGCGSTCVHLCVPGHFCRLSSFCTAVTPDTNCTVDQQPFWWGCQQFAFQPLSGFAAVNTFSI